MRLNNTPALETERLILRKFTENDIKAIFDIYSDPERNSYVPWLPVKTMDEARQLYEQEYAHTYRQLRGYRYAICLKSDNIPIGYVHVSIDDSFDLGYGLRSEFWNDGIITEAAQAVVTQVRDDGFPYITATHDIKNSHSGEVMQQLGMHYEYTYEQQWQHRDTPVTFRLYQLNFDSSNIRRYDKYWIISGVHYVEEEPGERRQ